MKPFHPAGRALLIGSLPLNDHMQAWDMVCRYTPEIPLWVQLPAFKTEGMMVQFLPGLPGLAVRSNGFIMDTGSETFDAELLAFYEDYMEWIEGRKGIDPSRFVLTPDTAPGFFVLLENIPSMIPGPVALKGQITGPITLGTGLKDSSGRSVFYNEQARDAVVKLLAQKARWQTLQLKRFDRPVLTFFDEPALAGFGSSAFISISRSEISACFEEVIAGVHEAGGLAGIHVCANTEWSLVLEAPTDVVSFDAYAYFEKLLLYPERVREFIHRGGILAWGIVPTLNPEDIDRETADSLASRWAHQFKAVVALGVDPERLLAQSCITPSCGTGSLDVPHALKVLELTREVSRKVRSRAF